MSRRRGLIALLIVACILVKFEGCSSQGEEDDSSSNEYIDNEIDLQPTYRSGIEKILQGLLKVVSPSSSSSSRSSSSASSENRSGGIIGFVTSHLPKPVKGIISGAENVTKRGFGDVLNLFEDNFHAIFPGTLWCGGGNIASTEEDVGLFKRTDACCRAHDNCPSNIAAGETRGNLVNNGIFTRSACFCDHQFYQCLKDVGSVVSANIGTTYFNILRPQCFAYDYPIESCDEYGSGRVIQKKCVKYNLDDRRNKTLEWFDNPDF